ncbi:MAG: 3-phosphoglycerate dehydrogenase [Oscillospiraceae bacterium]|nr:3-phosphoglycerate dehydrogenase [Oscillospiraceae bacterium]
MAPKIWINADPAAEDLSQLERMLTDAGFSYHMELVENEDEAAIIRLAAGCDAVICGLETWNERTISAVCGRTKFLLRFGTGYDSVDIASATRHGVLVGNTPGANAIAVAEIALLHILNLSRGFTRDYAGGPHGWATGGMGTELGGKTVGLVGFGNIARRLRELLRGFDVRVMAYDPYVSIDPEAHQVETAESPDAIFSGSDFVSLHVPCTAETAELVCERTLRMMKPTAYLVNTARGGLICEEDLLRALNEGWIAGAGLDVLNVEPGNPGSPLIGAKNLVLTPHLGGRSLESVTRSEVLLGQAMIDYFAGRVPFHALNPEVLQTR